MGDSVEIDLVFEELRLHRMIVYTNHPSAGYFKDHDGPQSRAFKLDAASNLVLWLLGKPHTNHAIQHHVAESKRSKLKTAPISDLQRYRRFKEQEQKVLEALAYHPKILAWAKQYLGEEFETTVEKGKSIAVECVEKLNKNAWASRIEKFLRMESGHQRSLKRELQSDDHEASASEKPKLNWEVLTARISSRRVIRAMLNWRYRNSIQPNSNCYRHKLIATW